MAQEPSQTQPRAPWTKIFTAFKIALDMKKLVLAAAGIFLAWVGWWGISGTFSYIRGAAPEPKNFEGQWNQFKARRASWNLLHELAGSPDDHRPQDAGDVAKNQEEYELLHKWEEAHQRLSKPLPLKDRTIKIADLNLEFTLIPAEDDAKAFEKLKDKSLTVASIVIPAEAAPAPKVGPEGKEAETPKTIVLDGVTVKVEGKFEDLKKYREGAWTLAQIAEAAGKEKDQKLARQSLQTFTTHLVHPKFKPSGLLRISPWSEERGGNPYLIVADTLKAPVDAAGTGGSILNWVFSRKALVLVEPLVKFLSPVVYLFDARAGFMDRLYLILLILWTLTIWGFFGGAICRIAAVQIARNERISLTEAVAFTRERCVSYLAAPAFPMALIALFVLALMIFGWIEWIPWFGDLWAGFLWPIVILVGFTMAIVLVGLVGWPLMIATISTEGTDSFDALSRSYSYVYQAPWQYLWYSFLAVLYGAALVFFVGFMASLMVFLGKWGVASAVGLSDPRPDKDREPSYLFYYAPTSYGWRDLLISSNVQHIETRKVVTPSGLEVDRIEFKPDYEKNITNWNSFGAILVAVWIYPLFLLVLGFGFSYFWSASTIIYFLMRHHVDDTDMDEVHQEDEDLEDPFMKATTAPPAAAPPPASKPGTLSLNVVDAPPPAPTSYTADEHPPSPPPSPPADGHP